MIPFNANASVVGCAPIDTHPFDQGRRGPAWARQPEAGRFPGARIDQRIVESANWLRRLRHLEVGNPQNQLPPEPLPAVVGTPKGSDRSRTRLPDAFEIVHASPPLARAAAGLHRGRFRRR
jgi:hypothetical protein